MKKVYLAFAIAGIISSCGTDKTNDQAKSNDATKDSATMAADSLETLKNSVPGYHYYGLQLIDDQNTISVAEMKTIIDSTGNFTGKIAAQLTGVCKKAGCWVTIKDTDSTSIRVMFGEHDFFVPTDTPEDKQVILSGSAMIDTISVDMQKHFLDDAKEAGEEISQAEYDAITKDKIEISFVSNAILIKQ